MPIKKLLATSDFTPEERHTLELAFERTLKKLSPVDRNDPLCEMIARKVIGIGSSGPPNAVAISEMTAKHFSQAPY